MSFLLGRSHQQQQQQQHRSGYSNNNELLYDASSDIGDDELEAAFGDSDAPELDNRADYASRPLQSSSTDTHISRTSAAPGIALNAYRPEGHSHVGEESINMDDNDSENDHLLQSSSSAPGIERSRAPGGGSARPQVTSTQTGSSSPSSNAGGYDFEADPYERRSAPISLGPDDDDDHVLPSSSSSSNSRRRRGQNGHPSSSAGSGLLATLRNILPSRFRHYGVLGSDHNRTTSGRRTDGTTDHGDDEDDEDNEAWIAPPPSMPGIYGGGLSNDGVFANMAAKPGNSRSGDRSDIVGGDDEAPEKEIPPAYELAVLDAAPPYFDTTVHAPGLGGIGGSGGGASGLEEILIEGLPLGNPFSFFWSLLVSMSFQFVGFLLTTLLSTSHAAKNGSRAGLGVTLIQYGLYLGTEGEGAFDAPPVSDGANGEGGKDEWAAFWGGGSTGGEGDAASTATGAAMRLVARTIVNGVSSMNDNATATDPWRGPVLLDGGAAVSGVATSWLSMVLMIGGWFLLVSSLVSYLKAIRYAKALRDGSPANPDSWLERGGPIGALYTRFTGRELPTFQQERTWGLAPRPAPTQPVDSDAPPPPPPSDDTRPTGFLPSFINRGATGVRSI